MNIVVLFNEVVEDAEVAESDVWTQCRAVTTAIAQLGYRAHCLGCTLDLSSTQRQLMRRRPDVVFNLVESLGRTDRLMPLATLLLESLSIPYTGASTWAILSSSNKVAAKQRLLAAGLPTPRWWAGPHEEASPWCQEPGPCSRRGGVRRATAGDPNAGPSWLDAGRECRVILKPVWEHASCGMDDDAVVTVRSSAELTRLLQLRQQRTGRPMFAESFIDGREFNLSLLEGDHTGGSAARSHGARRRAAGKLSPPTVLPPAEIDFSAFPPGKPRIVGHRAKWDADSFEYRHTPRRFDLAPSDGPLLQELSDLARQCWDLFGLRGYARVDFRVDRAGRPWILEINANPCLSPDAGFAAALERGGIPFSTGIERVIHGAVRGIRPRRPGRASILGFQHQPPAPTPSLEEVFPST